MVNVTPETEQIGIVVEPNKTELPEPPPVALSVTVPPWAYALVAGGLKTVMACAVSPYALAIFRPINRKIAKHLAKAICNALREFVCIFIGSCAQLIVCC